MSERDVIERTGEQPVTRDRLLSDLRRLGVQPGVVMLVHTRMSALGWICGGAQAVVEALLLAVGSEGTLVLPAFSSSLSEPRHWQDPAVPESWWPTVRAQSTAYDPERTPTRALGVVPELFRRWPGVQRSAHPHNSFAALGPAAEHILHPHDPPYGFGERSPLGRLYEMDAHVLLLGVTHESNTSLHLAEHRANYPWKCSVMDGAPLSTGWVEFERLNGNGDDFQAIGEAFGDGETQGRVGCGEARWMRQRAIVDFGAAWMEANRRTGT